MIEEKKKSNFNQWTPVKVSNIDEKKRIAIFADVLEENFDGVSITLNKILDSIPRHRFEVLIITSHPPKDITNFPHKIILLPYIKVPFQKGYRLGIPKKSILNSVLDDFKPDLLHFTSPTLFGRYAINYGKRHNIPVLNIYHTHYPAYFQYYIGKIGNAIFGPLLNTGFLWYYKKSDITLAPTRTIKKDLIKRGVKANKIKIWGRAIKTNSFAPSYRDPNYFNKIPQDYKKVLFVSRLIKEKEMSTIVKVYRHLERSNEKIKMIITGDGPEKEYLQKRMANAVFTGKKTGEELSKIYASSDLFFFPSASETFGNVVIEAMASGLAVVAADSGGPAELVRDKKTGYLVKTGKSKIFAKKIIELLNDDDTRNKMVSNALELIQPQTIENLHIQLWKYYENAIANHQEKQLASR
ncbi:glycosyltransferase family 4 protein [Reichenbachiella versicolor]|uniref:glycosyltransferase family 4 protein n=1 Tax=Reichenbachiella versicolor TaxID=1821036 RepID=UPI0013A565F5|nr:glycosyltransferase family 1 protein [Reichenbachiella versicolor]